VKEATSCANDVEHLAKDAWSLAAAVTLSVVAVATFNLLPQLMQAVVDDLKFSEREIGFLSSSMMACSTVGAIVATLWVRSVSWHRAAYLGLVGLVAANWASLTRHELVPFFALQCIVGFCSGSLYSLALVIMSDSRTPDRAFGYTIAAQAAFQFIGLLAGPTVFRLAGVNGILGVLALSGIVGALLVTLLPLRGRRGNAGLSGMGFLTLSTLLALAGCFLFFFNVGCYWTYVELIGSASGLGLRQLANGLAVGVVFGVVGGLLASWLGERRGHLAPLAGSAVVTVIAVLLLLGTVRFVGFVTSSALYCFAWNLSLAYQYATVNAADRSGRGIAAAPAFHNAGFTVGPAIAGILVSPRDHGSIVWLVCASVLASLACFVAAGMLRPAPKIVPRVTSPTKGMP
jgi:MFS family permease